MMATAEEPREDDKANEVAEMQGLGCRVETAIDPERSSVGRSERAEIVAGKRIEKTAVVENVDDIGGGGGGGGANGSDDVAGGCK